MNRLRTEKFRLAVLLAFGISGPAAAQVQPIDLHIHQVGETWITLEWIAPEGATWYDLRGSTDDPFDGTTDWPWNDPNNVGNVPPPGDPGSVDEMTITGLVPDMTYWFAIRYDLSPISNNVTFPGLPDPLTSPGPQPSPGPNPWPTPSPTPTVNDDGGGGGGNGGGCSAIAPAGADSGFLLAAILGFAISARFARKGAGRLGILMSGALGMAVLIAPPAPEPAPPSRSTCECRNAAGIADSSCPPLESAPPPTSSIDASASPAGPRRVLIGGAWGFESDDASFSTAGGSLALRTRDGGELRLRLSAAGGLYAGEPAPFRPLGDDELSAERGPIVERLRPIAEGVEQLFDIPQPPGGDLAFRFDVGGNLRPPQEGTQGERLTFWNGRRAGATYGKVVVVDAGGDRLPLPVAYRNGEISFTVPESWLSRASYPVVVDPLIGSVVQVSQNNVGFRTGYPQLPDHDLAYSRETDRYLSVYTRASVDLTAASTDLGANLIDAGTGAVGFPITLDDSAGDVAQPAVAWNPSSRRYLVVYCSSDGPDDGPWRAELRGIVLNEFGGVVDGQDPFTIAGPAGSYSFPRVGCDGTNWLVAWTGAQGNGRIVNGSATNAPAQAGRFGRSFSIDAGSAPPVSLDVAFGAGGDYLIVWNVWEAGGVNGSIRWRLVAPDGVIGATRFEQPGLGPPNCPRAVANAANGEFLLGWTDYAPESAELEYGIPAVLRVNSAGEPQGAALGVNPFDYQGDASSLTLTWNDRVNQYFIAWCEGPGSYTIGAKIRAARLRGEDLQLLQSNLLIAEDQTVAAYYRNSRVLSAPSRAGTSQLVVQWRTHWDYLGENFFHPHRLLAIRVDLSAPPSPPTGGDLLQGQGISPFLSDPPETAYYDPPRKMSFQAGSMVDPDGDHVQLRVELTSETGSVMTFSSPLVDSGGTGELTTPPIPNGRYQWRAQFVDQNGTASDWVSFGPDGGAFDFRLFVPNTPPPPPDVGPTATAGQFRRDGVTAIGIGDPTEQSAVVLRAELPADPDEDYVRLEVEVREDGVPFTGTATATSAFGPPGNHQVSVSIAPDTKYHWQAWIRDNSGEFNSSSPSRIPFGDNEGPGEFDFRRLPNTAPDAPEVMPAGGSVGQFASDGLTALPLGAVVQDHAVVFRGRVADPDGDACALAVEIKAVDQPFDGTISVTGSLVETGDVSIATFRSIPKGNYHWRAAAVDAYGLSSGAFAVFGSNGDALPADADFSDAGPAPGGSAGDRSCLGGAAGGRNAVIAGLALLLALLHGQHRGRP